MDIAFSSLKHGITVYRDAEGKYVVEGAYEGKAIVKALPMDGGNLCVLLLDPDASKDQRFENLICVNRSGTILWRAKLPTSPDVFVTVEVAPDGISASSWSGLKLHLDPKTGQEIRRNLTK